MGEIVDRVVRKNTNNESTLQVGSGYMNYRKQKAAIADEMEAKRWELEKSAMEQFDALRRELFATAWRLADTYDFPDAYRLTERQIKQYNAILMDPNLTRRYERLKTIENDFEAYPPFSYYLGNTALQLNRIEEAQRNFDKLIEFSEDHSLLRLNQIAASCYLEYVDILTVENSERNREQIAEYLKKAIIMSGGACDVLQICMMDYLKIGCIEEAEAVLLRLINEKYNVDTNARYLSLLYASDFARAGQNKEATERVIVRSAILEKCVEDTDSGSFHVPLQRATDPQLLEEYKISLTQKAHDVIESFKTKYQIQFNRCLPAADGLDRHDRREEISNMYFADAGHNERLIKAEKYLNNERHTFEYLQSLNEPDWKYQALNGVLNEMLKALIAKNDTDLPDLFQPGDSLEFQILLGEQIHQNGELFRLPNGNTTEDAVVKNKALQCGFNTITDILFETVTTQMIQVIQSISDLPGIMRYDLALRTFCDQNDISYVNNVLTANESNAYLNHDLVGVWLLGSEYEKTEKIMRKNRYFAEVAKTYRTILEREATEHISAGKNNSRCFLYQKGEEEFAQYFAKGNDFVKSYANRALFVLDDTGSYTLSLFKMDVSDSDIIFTESAVVFVNKKAAFPYKNIRYNEKDKALVCTNSDNRKFISYTNPRLNMKTLYKECIEKIAEMLG